LAATLDFTSFFATIFLGAAHFSHLQTAIPLCCQFNFYQFDIVYNVTNEEQYKMTSAVDLQILLKLQTEDSA